MQGRYNDNDFTCISLRVAAIGVVVLQFETR